MKLRHRMLIASAFVTAGLPLCLGSTPAFGSEPTLVGPQTPVPPAIASLVSADSAEGCTGNTICIAVSGSGDNITQVGGGVAVPGGADDYEEWCGRIVFTYDNVSYPSPVGCADPFTVFYYIFPNGAGTYSTGTRLCVRATTLAGYYNPGTGSACETVE